MGTPFFFPIELMSKFFFFFLLRQDPARKKQEKQRENLKVDKFQKQSPKISLS